MARPRVHILHGTGSDGAFVRQAFDHALFEVGFELHAPTVRSGDIADCVATFSDPCDVIGGISLGAHAAALRASATQDDRPLILVMPAWTGVPEQVAAATRGSADQIESRGVVAVLDELDESDWVVRALRNAWREYDEPHLVQALRAAADSRAPTPAELAVIKAPTLLIALRDDPLHPLPVAHQWHRVIPKAQLAVLPRDLAGRGAGELGQVAAQWLVGLP